MVTWLKEEYRSCDDTMYREGVCLSTDTKPTPADMANGSKLEVLNTGDVYRFDRDSSDWVKQWTMPQATESAGG